MATMTNMERARRSETEGTYNGTMGTYRCNGAAVCTVELDADGVISAMIGAWIFTPDADATTDQPDYADYLSYGFWLQRTTDEDGVLTYDEVETFADGSWAGRDHRYRSCNGLGQLRL